MILRILVVDDDNLTSREIKLMLSQTGHYVETADSGITALKVLKERQFDVMFLDLKMPNMSGIEVLKALKARNMNMYVIMITAYATIETAVEAMKLGAYDYIKKPFKPKQLHALVNNVIQEIGFEKGFRSLEVEKPDADVYQIFAARLAEGHKGLCISKRPPQDLLKELGPNHREALKDSIFWITESGDNWQAIHPRETEDLEEILDKFLGKGNGVILLDGIELLMKYNPWPEVKRLITDITERISSTSSHLIISMDPQDIGKDELWELKNIFRDTYGDYVFDSLANSMRRDIVKFLTTVRKAGFTTILRGIDGGDSPKFTFHLKRLLGNDIVEKGSDGKYSLTERGEKLYEIFSRVSQESSRDAETRIDLILSTDRQLY